MISRPGDRRVMWAIAVTGLVSSLQFTLMVPALPALPGLLGVSASDASWIVTITLLTGTVVTPIMTRLADLHGRKRMLLIAMIVLGIGSLVAMIGASNFWAVLVGRALQGFGTTIVPVGASLLRGILPRDRALVGVALMSGTIGIGSGFGLPLAGVLLALGGLPLTFFISVLTATIASIFVWRVVHESPVRAEGSFDLFGATVMAVGLTSLLLIVSKIGVWGATSPEIIACTITLIVATIIFVPWQLRASSPVIDLKIAMRPTILIANAVAFLTSFGMFANHLLTMQEARAPLGTDIGLGLPAITAGLVLLPFAASMIGGSAPTAALMRRYGTRVALFWGCALMTLAFGFRAVWHDGLLSILIGALIAGLGTAMVFGTLPTLVMDAVPVTQASSANGLNSLLRSFSGAAASAAFALLLTEFAIATLPDFLTETGLVIGFVTVAVLCFLSTVLTWFLPKQSSEALS